MADESEWAPLSLLSKYEAACRLSSMRFSGSSLSGGGWVQGGIGPRTVRLLIFCESVGEGVLGGEGARMDGAACTVFKTLGV
jgi:hypothetical protein